MKNLYISGQNNWIKSASTDIAFLHLVKLNCMRVTHWLDEHMFPFVNKSIFQKTAYFCWQWRILRASHVKMTIQPPKAQ